MNLKNITDAEILSGMKIWVSKEREAVTHVLHYLLEVEERKLYLKNGSSLFEFCMKEHGYSRHEAQTRIDAMYLLKSVPEIDNDLDSGKISLTVAASAQSAFRKENARRVQKARQPMTEEEKKTVLADLMSASTREADRKLASHFPEQAPFEKTKPLSEDLTRIEFNASKELMAKLEQLKTRLGKNSWDELFDKVADMAIAQLDAPKCRARGVKEKSAASEIGRPKPTRYIRKYTKHQVWTQWERGCDHILDNGQRCGCSRNLQIDHIQEYSHGGGNERENLRLMCAPHNRARSDRRLQLLKHADNRCQSVKDELFGVMLAFASTNEGSAVFGLDSTG